MVVDELDWENGGGDLGCELSDIDNKDGTEETGLEETFVETLSHTPVSVLDEFTIRAGVTSDTSEQDHHHGNHKLATDEEGLHVTARVKDLAGAVGKRLLGLEFRRVDLGESNGRDLETFSASHSEEEEKSANNGGPLWEFVPSSTISGTSLAESETLDDEGTGEDDRGAGDEASDVVEESFVKGLFWVSFFKINTGNVAKNILEQVGGVGKTDGLNEEAWVDDGVEGHVWEIHEGNHLVGSHELRWELTEGNDDDHKKNRVKPEELGGFILPFPVADVEVFSLTTTDTGDNETIEEKEELTTDEESFNVWTLVDDLGAGVGALVGVLVEFLIDTLETDDGDLATFEECNPEKHNDENGNFTSWVNVAGGPWWVVPLLSNTVEHDNEGKDEECKRPVVGKLAPSDGDWVVLGQ